LFVSSYSAVVKGIFSRRAEKLWVEPAEARGTTAAVAHGWRGWSRCLDRLWFGNWSRTGQTHWEELFFLAKRTNVPYTVYMSITERRKQILEWVAGSQARNGFPPAVREIGKALGLASPGSLHKHLQALEKEGYLERSPGKKRTWNLTAKGWNMIGRPVSPSIPLLGQIAAGTPILAEQNREEELPIDPALFGAGEVFALRVRGDSMVDAHIQDGDLAIIRPQEEAQDGQIVAVQVEDLEPEATLKVLRRRNGAIELHPANSQYKPLIFRGAQRSRVRILGRLVGVIRPKA